MKKVNLSGNGDFSWTEDSETKAFETVFDKLFTEGYHDILQFIL